MLIKPLSFRECLFHRSAGIVKRLILTFINFPMLGDDRSLFLSAVDISSVVAAFPQEFAAMQPPVFDEFFIAGSPKFCAG
jgi:hypothetical protein